VEEQPEDLVQRAERRLAVKRALSVLPAKSREILKLQFTEGLGYEAIAARIGSTPRAVKRAVIKSYDRLRIELKSESEGVIRHGRK
jgi:RNA polymerase sigma-70 factor (ECF subfamily)